MNNKLLMIKRTSTARLVKMTDRHHRNSIRFSKKKAESDKHFAIKCLICRELKNMDKEFLTEARFKNGSGRADILILDKRIAIEIKGTESEESIVKKATEYPVKIEVIRVKDHETIKSVKAWIEDVLNCY